MQIDVIYIARGIDWGIKTVKKFIESYKNHPAGYPHNLIIAAKAWETLPEEYAELKQLANEAGAEIINLPDDGLDFGAYYRTIQNRSSDYIFCLSTFCVILQDNWLKVFTDNMIKNTNLKLAAPMGSWEKCPVNIQNILNEVKARHKIRNLNYKLDKVLSVIKNFGTIVKYSLLPQNFPNYHIRTCAFIVDSQLFINYFTDKKLPKNKLQAYCIESGKESLTQYCIKNGYQVGILGKDNKLYAKEEWDKSKTFRCPDMSNLLIMDKQAKLYINSDTNEKAFLEKVTWGYTFTTNQETL